MFGLFILEFPSSPPFFFLCWTANWVHVLLCLSSSLPLPWVLPVWALECTYLSSVARQRGRKTFFFLFLYSFFKEKSLGLKVPIWRHSKYSLSLRFLYSKFGVFLAEVNGTGTKRIMNVIFFPCYCSLHCFFFLFVWVYLKENLFCNDCLQFKSINPKFFQETDKWSWFYLQKSRRWF